MNVLGNVPEPSAEAVEEPDWKAGVYYDIAVAQAEVDDFAGAGHTAATVEDTEWKRRAYYDIAKAQARASEIEDLKVWIETLADPNDVLAACLGAAEGLVRDTESGLL